MDASCQAAKSVGVCALELGRWSRCRVPLLEMLQGAAGVRFVLVLRAVGCLC